MIASLIMALMLSLLFVLMSAVVDSEHLKDNDFIEDHRSRWVMRLIFFIAIGMVNPFYGIMAALLFAGLFDQVLNEMMDDEIWHLGETASWDIFFTNKLVLYKIVKVSCVALAGVAAYTSTYYEEIIIIINGLFS